MNRCATCRHWDAGDSIRLESVSGERVGRCKAVPMFWDAPEWNDGGERVLTQEHRETTAFALDGSDFAAKLYTRAEHGCTMHQPRD